MEVNPHIQDNQRLRTHQNATGVNVAGTGDDSSVPVVVRKEKENTHRCTF